MIDLNPLDLLNIRQLSFLPPHFSKVEIDGTAVDLIRSWILSKLKGRYCIVKTPMIGDNGLKSLPVVGFEDEQELLVFILSCPHFRRN